jgi:hypothetical protein
MIRIKGERVRIEKEKRKKRNEETRGEAEQIGRSGNDAKHESMFLQENAAERFGEHVGEHVGR